MRVLNIIVALTIFGISPNAHAELLGKEWINETEMKKQSQFARKHGLLLVDLDCRFRKDADNPGRKDVIFRADFEQPPSPVGWGWTFDANAPNLAAEQQALNAGFEMVSEDYFEISGVTWVRCKVWHHGGAAQ